MSDANKAILQLLDDGPDFHIPDSVAGNAATNAAKIQYTSWMERRVKPLLAELLSRQGAGSVSTGGAYFGGAVSAGRDVAGGDIRSGE